MSDDSTEVEVVPPIVPGVARALSPLLRRIALDVGGVAGPNTYLIGIDEIVVVDPGPDVGTHLDAVAGCCGDRLRWIVCTGAADASGAKSLAARSGAQLLGVPGVGPAKGEQLAHGDTILGTEFRLTVLPAPGLAVARACFHLEDERVVITGDWVPVDDPDTPVVRPDVVDAQAYAEGLAALPRRRLRAIAPVLGHLVEDPKAALDAATP
jgi:glyoxylase-like metal-dependent hydrolase (beta-lactamase superfamily II)